MDMMKHLNYEGKVERTTNKAIALMHALYNVKRGNEESFEMAKTLIGEMRDDTIELIDIVEYNEIERKSEEARKIEIMSFMKNQ